MFIDAAMVNMEQIEFDKYINELAKAQMNKSIKEMTALILAEHGFERWLYATENPNGRLGVPTTLANECGKWMLTYMVRGYQKIDPILSHCRVSTEPLLWDPIVGWETADAEVKDMMVNVAANGFGSGVAIPLRGPENKFHGIFNVTSAAPLSEARNHFEKNLPRLTQVGKTIHSAMINIMMATICIF